MVNCVFFFTAEVMHLTSFVFRFILPGVAGAALLYAVTPVAYRSQGNLGALFLHEEVNPGVGVVIEAVLTYQFIFVVVSSTDPIRNMTGFQAPFAIGLSVGIGLLMGVSFFICSYFLF